MNCSIDNSGLSFDMNEDTQLVVPASAGILSKAIDISRLSIVSVQPTWRGGIVTLNMTDGSFTYGSAAQSQRLRWILCHR